MSLNSKINYAGLNSPRKSVLLKDCESIKGSDSDEIAALLDSVPELDSLFSITKKIGHGTFSSVYLGHSRASFDSSSRKYFAIKHIIPTSHPSRIYMELKCLKLMGGKDNIIGATICFRNLNHIVLVMPYIPHDSFTDYVGNLTTEELCDYTLNLLKALDKIHSYRIIHRDIKPANFLYCRKYRRYALIDFGLAQDANKKSDQLQTSWASRNGNERKSSSKIIDTPHLNTSRTVKRKLPIGNSVCNGGKNGGKRPRLASVFASSHGSFPSISVKDQDEAEPTTPRKSLSDAREGQRKDVGSVTPKGKGGLHHSLVNDSPSKHTRLAEATKAAITFSTDCKDSYTGFANCLKKLGAQPGSVIVPRRSPRKPVNIYKNLNDSFDKLTKLSSSLKVSTKSELDSSVATFTSGYPANRSLSSKNAEKKRESSLQEVKTRSGRSVLRPTSCSCYGSSKVCSVCLGRKNQHAPRAGTPGFRAPEVLLRHPDQTTALDIWSSGVVLLCLASSRYPFFRATDDMTSLAEITTVFGSKAMKKMAAYYEKLLTMSEEWPPLDLRKVCQTLRKKCKGEKGGEAAGECGSKGGGGGGVGGGSKASEVCRGCKQARVECVCCLLSVNSGLRVPGIDSSSEGRVIKDLSDASHSTKTYLNSLKAAANQSEPVATSGSVNGGPVVAGDHRLSDEYPPVFYDLLYKLLDPNPATRMTAEAASSHPFIVQYSERS